MSKKSFILHDDSLSILDKMTDQQAGIFIKAIYHYRKFGVLPELDFGIEMAVSPFINQLIRDNEKWRNIENRNKINGLKGGRPKTQINPENPVGYLESQNIPNKPKKAVNVNVNVNGNVSVNDNVTNLLSDFDKSEQEKINEWLKHKVERKQGYKPTGLKTLINRLKDDKKSGKSIITGIDFSMQNNYSGIFYPNQCYPPQTIKQTLKNCNSQLDMSNEEF
jgi:hypothetical protein